VRSRIAWIGGFWWCQPPASDLAIPSAQGGTVLQATESRPGRLLALGQGCNSADHGRLFLRQRAAQHRPFSFKGRVGSFFGASISDWPQASCWYWVKNPSRLWPISRQQCPALQARDTADIRDLFESQGGVVPNQTAVAFALAVLPLSFFPYASKTQKSCHSFRAECQPGLRFAGSRSGNLTPIRRSVPKGKRQCARWCFGIVSALAAFARWRRAGENLDYYVMAAQLTPLVLRD